MTRMRSGFRLIRQSAHVVRGEPVLLGLILLGIVVQVAIFFALFFAAFGRAPVTEDFRFPAFLWVVPILFVAGLPGSVAGATVVAVAMQKLQGQPGSVRDGFALALARFPQIVLFSVLAAGVGIIIQLIVEKLKIGGRLAAMVVGASWTVVTMLVIPVILFENANALEAVKRSGSLIKQRWGEGVTGHASLVLALMIVMVPILMVGAILIPFNLAVGVTVIVGSMLVLMTISGALGGVFNAALYRYAAEAQVSPPFERSQLEGAFESKRDRSQASSGRKALRIVWIALVVVYVGLRLLRTQLGGP
ncbi:MAG: DUF6159 family protein [Actinomycetota bacterium]|nr:DUF6159 family protein [Actinomycetota bacterium]